MMSSSNFNVRLDQERKERAFPTLEHYGLTSAQAFKLFLNQVVETKAVPLSFGWGKNDLLSVEAQTKLHQSKSEFEQENIPESVNQALLSAYPDEAERERKILSLLTQFAQNEKQKIAHTQRFDETRTLTARELIAAVGVTTHKKASIDDMNASIFETL